MMPRMRQALVEFEKVDEALACVQSCQVRMMTSTIHSIVVYSILSPSLSSDNNLSFVWV